MSWDDKAPAPKCDECGRFISFADLQAGTASHRMLGYDYYGHVRDASLCSKCNAKSEGK